MDKYAKLQYALAALSVVAMVIINLFGVESVAVNTTLASVITSTVWGANQRKEGYRKGLMETPTDAAK